MAKRAEVVVVGGGIVGCATAYFLARKGVEPTLIEREGVGSCSSGFAAGLLNPLDSHGIHGIPGPLEALTRQGFPMHQLLVEEVEGETGIDPKLEPLSCMWLAFSESEAEETQELFQLAQRLKWFPTRRLDGQEIRSLEPRLSPEVIAATCLEGMWQIDCYQYTLGLARAAEKYGAAILQGTVRGLAGSGGRITGVIVDGEELACDKVVLAMGPWTREASDWLGIPVPVGPLKGQILRLEAAGPPLGHAFYSSGGNYVMSKSDGLVWVGTTEERVGFDDRPTAEARESIIKGAVKTMPYLSGAHVALQTACLRPVSEDGLPIIGAVPGWEGVYLATGAGRKGIVLGPVMAQAMADLVTTGCTDLPIEPFSPGRFATE